MADDKVSIIIPSCNEKYLQKTIDCLVRAAKEEIEIIVYLDKYWPDPPLKANDKVTLIHSQKKVGMRPGINAAVRIASGKYIMKCDAHCDFDNGFDVKLKADCEKDWLVIPSRYGLDHKTWKRGRGPVDYLYLSYPHSDDETYGIGFHGKKWKGKGGNAGSFWHLERERKDILIDDILTFQGSCYFMHKELFEKIGLLDDVNYGYCGQEAQELGFKVWLSGGRIVRNKKTWYAHLHKNKDNGGRGFFINKKEKDKSTAYAFETWMNNRWPGQTRDLKWLIDKFGPLDGWPEGWEKMEHKNLKF